MESIRTQIFIEIYNLNIVIELMLSKSAKQALNNWRSRKVSISSLDWVSIYNTGIGLGNFSSVCLYKSGSLEARSRKTYHLQPISNHENFKGSLTLIFHLAINENTFYLLKLKNMSVVNLFVLLTINT